MEELIKDVTQTKSGYLVRNLKWNQLDNIIVGQVKCPIFGKEEFNEGYVVCQWRRNGSSTNRFKNRTDLRLDFNF